MAVATLEQLNSRAPDGGQSFLNHLSYLVHRAAQTEAPLINLGRAPVVVEYNPELGQRALDAIKSLYHAHRLGKVIRPWQIVDISSGLDPEQPWVGMEYETGFDSAEHYAAAVEELWNNHTNNTMDGEGYGSWSAELTFAPVNLSDFNSPEYNIDRVIRWSEDRGGALKPYDTLYGTWGMHVNFSTPAMREGGFSYIDRLSAILSASAHRMTYEQKEEVFGRDPYGFFEARNDALGGKVWIEGKLFRTTTDMDEWHGHKYVINNLLAVVAKWDSNPGNRIITNFYELLTSDDVASMELEYGQHYGNYDYDDDDNYYYDEDDDD